MRAERFIEDRTRSDLVPVVILGVNPEHGHDRHVVFARDFFGQFESRQRFMQREQWTAEKPGLLSGDERNGTGVSQLACRLARSSRSTALRLLARENLRHLAAITRIRLRAANGMRPSRAIGRITAEKRRQRRKIVGVVRGETPRPREAPDVDCDPSRWLARGV